MNKYIDALNVAIENAKRNVPAYELNEIFEKNLRPIGIGWHDLGDHLAHRTRPADAQLALRLTASDLTIEEEFTKWIYPTIHNYEYIDNGISEDHEQYNYIWNQLRRSYYKDSIELKLGNKYILQVGLSKFEMYLIRIQDDELLNHQAYPILYFSKDPDTKIGTNFGVLRIINQIKEENE